MVKFKNMKILVENNLDEIVIELDRLGFCYNCGCDDVDAKNGDSKQSFHAIRYIQPCY